MRAFILSGGCLVGLCWWATGAAMAQGPYSPHDPWGRRSNPGRSFSGDPWGGRGNMVGGPTIPDPMEPYRNLPGMPQRSFGQNRPPISPYQRDDRREQRMPQGSYVPPTTYHVPHVHVPYHGSSGPKATTAVKSSGSSFFGGIKSFFAAIGAGIAAIFAAIARGLSSLWRGGSEHSTTDYGIMWDGNAAADAGVPPPASAPLPTPEEDPMDQVVDLMNPPPMQTSAGPSWRMGPGPR